MDKVTKEQKKLLIETTRDALSANKDVLRRKIRDLNEAKRRYRAALREAAKAQLMVAQCQDLLVLLQELEEVPYHTTVEEVMKNFDPMDLLDKDEHE